MRIAIDVSQIVYGTGVSVYTEELVKNLVKIDKKNEYVLFGGSLRRRRMLKDKIKNLGGKSESKIYFLPPAALDVLWNRLHVLPVEVLTGKIDVYHSSDWAQAPSGAFSVTTIHDFAPLKFKKETHPRIVAVHERRLAWVKKEVDRVIVPSDSTKRDAIEYGIKASKIVVIPEASGVAFYRRGKKEVNSVKNELGIVGEYVIAYGTSKRKNVERTVKAFDQLRKKGLLETLVIVGNASHNIKTEKGVVITGYVSDDALASLYSGAGALVYASLYEGFGLPILQAFSCYCPVVTSELGSMKEVSGGAAVLVDPMSVSSIANGIKKAIDSTERLERHGARKVKDFSWKETAGRTMDVYEQAV